MNRLRILLITTALITGSSALASAQQPYQSGFAVQVRLGSHDGERDRDDRYRRNGYYGYGDGDHDRDDRHRDGDRDRDDRYFHQRKDRDDYRWRFFWSRDRDHDGDRR